MACVHDHSCEDHDCSSSWSLYKHIDMSKVSALNEAVRGSVKSVFRAWEHRFDSSGSSKYFETHAAKNFLRLLSQNGQGYLESNEGDPELIVFIPFTSDVKLRSISVVGGADGTSPSKMRAFINRDGIDFSDAQSMQPVQIFKISKCGKPDFAFPDNYGGDTSQIHYIGLKGEATQMKRDVVATIVYELMPNPSDHKTKAESGGGLSQIE
ncbi:unnamed protein product [Rhodiola kirilowii]